MIVPADTNQADRLRLTTADGQAVQGWELTVLCIQANINEDSGMLVRLELDLPHLRAQAIMVA